MFAVLFYSCILLGSLALFTVASIHGDRINRKQEQEWLAWQKEQARKRAEEERRLRALKIADVDSMGGLSFEHYVCRLLVSQGYTAHVTKASGDLGADIIAERYGVKYSIQVKRHNSSIDRHAVNDAVGGKAYYKCDRAMVVTNSYFGPGAIEMAQATNCELVDRDKLAKWIADYHNSDVPKVA